MKLPGFTAEASLDEYGSNLFFVGEGEAALRWGHTEVVPQLSIPVYGNWCGPGHPKRGNPPPIDAVDASCRRHDRCYSKRGYSNCRCDRNLIGGMPAAIRRTPSLKGKAAGAAIAAFFTVWPCVCRKRVCVPLPKCTMVKRCKRVFGKRFCIRVPKCRMVKRCHSVPVPGHGGLGIC